MGDDANLCVTENDASSIPTQLSGGARPSATRSRCLPRSSSPKSPAASAVRSLGGAPGGALAASDRDTAHAVDDLAETSEAAPARTRLFNRPITAEALLPRSPDDVFPYLCDLRNHWQLADRFIEVESLEHSADPCADAAATGGRVRIQGPLGFSRTAVTRITAIDPPKRMTGTARVGRRTTAEVSWLLRPGLGRTHVRLEAHIETASALDRVLLACGGRAWLRRRFAGVLGRLRLRLYRADDGAAAPSGAAAALRLAWHLIQAWWQPGAAASNGTHPGAERSSEADRRRSG